VSKPRSNEPAEDPDDRAAEPTRLPAGSKSVVPARRRILLPDASIPGFAWFEFVSGSVNVSFDCQFLDKNSLNPRPLIVMSTFVWSPISQTVEGTLGLNPWPTPTYISVDSPLSSVSISFDVLVQGLQQGDLFQIKTRSGILDDINLTWVEQNNTRVIESARANDAWTTFALLHT
jgi:hypothetical protein